MTREKNSDTDPQPSTPAPRGNRRALGVLAIPAALAALLAAASLILFVSPTAGLGRNQPATIPRVSPGNSQPAATPAVDPGNSQPAASPNASQVLLRAGTAAGAQPGGWPDAAYWHSVSSYRQGSGPLLRREVWAGHTAVGGLRDTRLSRGVIPLQDGRFAGLGWDELYALPTESGALESRLRTTRLDGIRDEDTELFALAGDLLRESPAPPALRKALWGVVAQVPGVTLVGAIKDSSGRSGIAIRRGDQSYVLDPGDGRLLEESKGISKATPDAPSGARWRATYLEQGPAENAPAPTPTNAGPKPAKG